MADKIEESLQTCAGWIASATATCADDQAEPNLRSTENVNRACGGFSYTQPTTIRNQWVGTQTWAAASCIGSAGNFAASASGVSTGGVVVKGGFSPIPVAINDSIQFTIQLDLT